MTTKGYRTFSRKFWRKNSIQINGSKSALKVPNEENPQSYPQKYFRRPKKIAHRNKPAGDFRTNLKSVGKSPDKPGSVHSRASPAAWQPFL
jgi:hypothetical protein